MAQLSDPYLKQLLYRAQHRGFKEADILFGGFAEAHLTSLSDAELREFEALMVLDCHDLYNWVIGREPAPANVSGPVFDKLQAFDVAAITAP
ncbi:MAG: succinate dehydrogenase assembly factor 2 [Pseudomonadota bacterium]